MLPTTGGILGNHTKGQNHDNIQNHSLSHAGSASHNATRANAGGSTGTLSPR
jgi:hypothetical protein